MIIIPFDKTVVSCRPVFLTFTGLPLWSQYQLILSDDVALDVRHAKPSEETGFQVQRPEHIYRWNPYSLPTDLSLHQWITHHYINHYQRKYAVAKLLSIRSI